LDQVYGWAFKDYEMKAITDCLGSQRNLWVEEVEVFFLTIEILSCLPFDTVF